MMARLHDGVATFVPTSAENDTVYFDSDRFSVYALVYKDMEGGNGDENSNPMESETISLNDLDMKAAKTSDKFDIIYVFNLIIDYLNF